MRSTTAIARRLFVSLFLCGLPATAADAPPRSPFSPERLGFTVRYHGEESSYRVNGVFVMPGEAVELAVVAPPATPRAFAVETAAGSLRRTGAARWVWTAPERPALYRIAVRGDRPAETMLLNVFVEVPASAMQGEYLNGYRIGRYPSTPLKGLDVYRSPRGFVEVTAENRDTLVSPHFRLGQFVCKQAAGDRRYLVLRERLLAKLELLLERVNRAGHRCDTLQVLSGYRTPFYNHAIGNVRYSRHIYGGAADVYIDDRGRGTMADLDGDGRSDQRDNAVLARMVEEIEHAPVNARLVGGMGLYPATSAHGPFVHVDARGSRARWGGIGATGR